VVWRAMGRLILVPLAFLFATLTAAFVLVTLGLERVTVMLHGRGAEPDSLAALIDLFAEGVLLASALTIIPALVVVLVGEIARIRSLLYYLVGGGAALLAVPLLARLGEASSGFAGTALWQVFATAGFAAGLVYWLIAGRTA
jgi:predicted outer membrane lipoprotein